MKTNILRKMKRFAGRARRTLVGESKFGLCPDCINKYGTPVAAGFSLVVIGSIGFIGRKVLTNGGKVAKVAIDVVKLIKP
jgi:hypothetical protein